MPSTQGGFVALDLLRARGLVKAIGATTAGVIAWTDTSAVRAVPAG